MFHLKTGQANNVFSKQPLRAYGSSFFNTLSSKCYETTDKFTLIIPFYKGIDYREGSVSVVFCHLYIPHAF